MLRHPLLLTAGALVAAAAAGCSSSSRAASSTAGTRTPVVVELFTSEGCSSCPPADALLKQLADTQPVDGAQIIALELHVDYWNDLGWADPFANAAFSERQHAYAEALAARGVYTPQVIVDGCVGFVGSKRGQAKKQIAAVAASSGARTAVSVAHRGITDDGTATLHVTVGASDAAADVMLAVTEDGLSTEVRRGENAGRTLAHGPVVRVLRRLAVVQPDTGWSGDATVRLDPAWQRSRLHAVIFVQRPPAGAITGAATIALR